MVKFYGSVFQLTNTGTDTITHTSTHHLIHEEYSPFDPFNETTFMSKFNSWLYTGAGTTFRNAFLSGKKLTSLDVNYNANAVNGKFEFVIWLGGSYSHATVLQMDSQSDFRTACADWGISINMTPPTANIESSTISFSGSTSGNATKQVKKLYGSVPTQVNVYSGEPRVAGTATFDASIFNANSTIKGIQGTISYLQFRDYADRAYLYAYLTDSTQIVLFDTDLGISGTFPEYGITQRVLDQVGYIDLTATTTTQNLTKQIKKLYGSVNGETKLVYEASNA